MAERQARRPDHAIDLWQGEVEELRQATLSRFVLAAGICTAVWLFWMSSPWGPSMQLGWGILATSAAFVYGAQMWRGQFRHLAAVLLVAGWIILQGIAVWFSSNPLTLALGLVSVVMGTALLGWSGGLVAGILSFATGLWAWQTFPLPDAAANPTGLLAVLYLLTWVGMCIAQYPLAEARRMALTGWFRLQESLDQVRDRRAELGRTLHALEEATYRIERMNSELLLARDEADAARENKQRFAQTVSHELRGPLNLILGFSKLMALTPERYGDLLPRSYRADVDAIYTSSQHIAALLDDVLDLSQIEAERMPLVKERIDLNKEVVGEAVRAVAPLAARKGLVLSANLDACLPHILGDRVRLRQVLLNLLTNALRFTDSGGITVTTRLNHEGVRISVTDTGRGISSTDLPRLFEEFHQLQLITNINAKGSGLGLAISRHLVNLHGGRIWAESIEGQGTTFHVVLPLGDEGAVPVSPRRRRNVEPVASTAVLVLADQPDMLRILARHLDGYQVIGLPTNENVLEAIQASHPHAIIASPEMCPALVETIAGTPYDVPVLGCSMPVSFKDASVMDAQAYLMKPINDEALRAALRRLELGPDAVVLIVDDEPDAVRLLESHVSTGLSRPRVLKAYGGEEALSVMRSEVPDAVLMDLVMPEMGAEEIIGQMRRSPALADVPVILVTGQDAHPSGASLGTYITLTSQRPVSTINGILRLKALLDVVAPDYLSAEAPGARPPAVALQ